MNNKDEWCMAMHPYGYLCELHKHQSEHVALLGTIREIRWQDPLPIVNDVKQLAELVVKEWDAVDYYEPWYGDVRQAIENLRKVL